MAVPQLGAARCAGGRLRAAARGEREPRREALLLAAQERPDGQAVAVPGRREQPLRPQARHALLARPGESAVARAGAGDDRRRCS